MNVIKYFMVRPNAIEPKPATSGSACFDIHACISQEDDGKIVKYDSINSCRHANVYARQSPTVYIGHLERVLIPTGLIFDIPCGYSIRLHARSGQALRQGLVLANGEGVIDEDYTQETFIMLTNIAHGSVEIKHGDRICQGELVPNVYSTFEKVTERPTEKTNRAGGFGSTGVENTLPSTLYVEGPSIWVADGVSARRIK